VSFEEPLALLCLFAVPLAILVHLSAQRRRRRYPVRFPALATLAAVASPEPAWRRQLPFALLTVAVAALAVSLARPQKTIQVPVDRASVVLVTDVSRSMSADDVNPTRLDAARQAALTFLGKVPDSLRVGLVAFSDGAQTLQSPTTDRSALSDALKSLEPINGTATGAGLRTALDDLRISAGASGRRPPAAVVLLSDGSATDGTAADDAAAEAGRLRVPIYTVALGTPDGTFLGGAGERKSARPDPAALARIASASGGRAFRAEDADELGAVYDQLGSQLGTKPGKREITTTFAGLALLLLAGAVASSLWLGGRLP
jgi:Ca-activated chloride channel family protein